LNQGILYTGGRAQRSFLIIFCEFRLFRHFCAWIWTLMSDV
jgi:hypothetical protein